METFKVKGMSCNHCKMAITKAIQGLDPKAQVEIDLALGNVKVDSKLPREKICEAIDDAGYELDDA